MALAQEGGEPAGGAGGGLMGMLPLVLIVVVMYFLMIRPQRRRQKAHQEMVNALKSGDEVVTSGGIHGTVSGIDEKGQTIYLKIAGDVKIKVDRSAVGRLADSAPAPTRPASS